jgi:DNA-binding NtrC family response regulator
MDDLTSIAAGLQQLAAQNEPADPYSGTESVLVVDDEALILELAKSALEEYGYNVKGALNAAEAIQLLVDGFKPEVLCCDIVLPGGMNGVELARKIHDIMPKVKVLLCSGYGAGGLDGSLSQDGFRMLAKPYTIEDLVKRVRHLLDGKI